MGAIHKHELIPGERVQIDCVVPLSVIEQNGKVMAYVIHDDMHNKPMFFYVFGTGDPVSPWDNLKFLSTVTCGPYVWHVFYRNVRQPV